MVHFCDQKHHVVVIGAGFGGLSVVRELEEPGVSITIIDRSNHHLFQPLLCPDFSAPAVKESKEPSLL